MALVLSGCSAASSAWTVSGRVADDTVILGVPNLAPASKQATTSAESDMPVARVSRVSVSLGDHVTSGEVVAVLDDRELAAGVEAARSAYRVAAARADVVDQRLDEVAEQRATIAENREDVESTIAELESTRGDLVVRHSEAITNLRELKALQRKLEKLPAGPPPPGATPPPGTPDPREVAVSIAKLEAGIAELDRGISRIDTGLARAREGLAKLETARAKTADARDTLKGLKGVSVLAARASRVGIDLAEQRRALATVRSPVEGVVTAAVLPGEALAANAPLVTVRPDAASAVEIWVTPAQRRRLAVADAATVRLDALPDARFDARVTAIGARAMYPPTWFATTVTHMTRAFSVTVTLNDPQVRLSPGTPVDVEIDP